MTPRDRLGNLLERVVSGLLDDRDGPRDSADHGECSTPSGQKQAAALQEAALTAQQVVLGPGPVASPM